MPLSLDLRPGDTVDIDHGRIVARVEAKSGQVTRISFEAPKEIRIVLVPPPGQFARRGLGKRE